MSKYKKIFHKKSKLPPSAKDIVNYLQGERNYELEKSMLDDAMVSDAVEGFEMFEDKKRVLSISEEINNKIAQQTRRDNKKIMMRIAAILIVIFLISGGSFYLFNSFNNDTLSEVASQKSVDNSGLSNSMNADTVSQIAIEDERKSVSKEVERSVVNSDAIVQREQVPSFMGEEEEKRVAYSEPTLKEDAIFEGKEIVVAPAPAEIKGMEELSLVEKNEKDNFVEESIDRKMAPVRSQSIGGKEKAKKTAAPASKSEMSIAPNGDSKLNSRHTLSDGIRLYNLEKYKEAEEIFSGVLMNQPINQEALFYKGMSLYKLKITDKALESLSKIETKTRHYDEAQWTMAQIYIETGQKEESVKLLKILAKPGNSYSEKADELLQSIKE